MQIAITSFRNRVLEPNERISEVLFGLIMVLTMTGSLSVADESQNEVRTMLIGAVGCNIAWGIIDSVMYLLSCLAEKERGLTILRTVRQSSDQQTTQQLIASSLPSVVASILQPSELEAISLRLKQLPKTIEQQRLQRNDYLGALGVFLLVFSSMFPVVIPFLFFQDADVALRVSNGIAILMLFLTGYAYGICVHRRPLLTGIAMVILGSLLVGSTMALGG
ncbi:MAG: VIT1/CCC1 transporter family protein [bacterium]